MLSMFGMVLLRNPRLRILVMVFLVLFAAGTLQATNGTNLTAYGARSAGMGGATLAVGGSVMDIQANPSQLARMKNSQFEGGIALLNPYLEYQDSLFNQDPNLAYHNKVKSERTTFPIPYIGFGTPLGNNMGLGIAFYGQGGMGAEFNGIRRPLSLLNGDSPYTMGTMMPFMASTPLGPLRTITENTYSNVSIAKLAVGFAVKLGSLSLGVAVDGVASTLEWRWMFADPTNMMEFTGFNYKGDPAYAMTGKVGLTFDVSDSLALAYAYQAKTHLNYDGSASIMAGFTTVPVSLNAVVSATTMPNVSSTRVSAYLEFPEEHTVGLAYKTGSVTVGLDVGYVKWSNVFRSVDFRVDNPVVPTPMGNVIDVLPFNVKWNDQVVYAVGVEIKPGETAYRFGYNFGRSPVREQGVNPLFPAITEHHVMVGLGISMGSLQMDFAIEYALPHREKSSNTNDWELFHAFLSKDYQDKELGNDRGAEMPMFSSEVAMYQITPHIGITYKF